MARRAGSDSGPEAIVTGEADGDRHVRSQLGAYALGALTREEDRLIAGHLDGCASCAAAYAEVADGAALLALFDEEDLW
ncbi:zf-HC2 domain-containing protein [Streptomyces sp. NPDC057307]|uniref:zf-HC2 domain-containing protein n=1 Tax=Streptomyces sp. NPDC057307 TaxID=3346096 RepID=UPI00363C4C19